MVELQRDHEAATDRGKDLHHVARYADDRPDPVPDREVLDVVTGDFRIYRFTRHGPDEPWSFEAGDGTDNRSQHAGNLPATVEAIIEAEAEDVAGEWGTGWSR